MKRTTVALVLLALLLLTTVAAAEGIITFYKTVKDPLGNGESDKVAILYNVESVGKNDVSNITFELKSCYELADCGEVVNGEYVSTNCEWVTPDPINGIYGIKFDRKIPVGETVTFWIMVSSGNPRITKEGETVQSATKSGGTVEYFDVPGLVCDPNSVDLLYAEASSGVDLTTVIGLIMMAVGSFILVLGAVVLVQKTRQR